MPTDETAPDVPTPPDVAPDVAEVYQEEPAGMIVPVEVAGPVRVQHPPARAGSMRVHHVGATIPAIVAQADPRRRRAVLVALDEPIILAPDGAQLVRGVAAVLPVGVPVELTSAERIYALCETEGQEGRLTVITEQWTE